MHQNVFGVQRRALLQTHFDASTGLITDLVAASFSFAQHFTCVTLGLKSVSVKCVVDVEEAKERR